MTELRRTEDKKVLLELGRELVLPLSPTPKYLQATCVAWEKCLRLTVNGKSNNKKPGLVKKLELNLVKDRRKNSGIVHSYERKHA